MNRIHTILFAIIVPLVVFIVSGCSGTNKLTIGGEGEESNAELALNEQYDKVRNGARLILTYDAQSNSFKGTVENTTDETLKQVRVEVHLSNGVELGPTTPGDLAPGEQREIELVATSTDFTAWTAHPEVGGSEHGGESNNEHDAEGDSEHN
jgi:uncharacterized protein YceK